MTDYYRDVTNKLREENWIKHREAKGSHEMWKNMDTNEQVSVPRKLKSRHTANGILKSAGIDHKV